MPIKRSNFLATPGKGPFRRREPFRTRFAAFNYDNLINGEQNWFDYGGEDQELSFTFHDGLPPDDVVAAVDNPAQGLEWLGDADDDLSYSFAVDAILAENDPNDLPYEALEVYGDDAPDDYSFADGQVEEIAAPVDDMPGDSLPFAYFDYGDDEQDYSFSYGPLPDEPVAGYPSAGKHYSPSIQRQRQKRRRKLLERIRKGSEPPLGQIEAELAAQIETAAIEPEEAAEFYTTVGVYLTSRQAEHIISPRMVELLQMLEALNAAMQRQTADEIYHAALMARAIEEEEIMIMMALQ